MKQLPKGCRVKRFFSKTAGFSDNSASAIYQGKPFVAFLTLRFPRLCGGYL
jgi:hypothetical protein